MMQIIKSIKLKTPKWLLSMVTKIRTKVIYIFALFLWMSFYFNSLFRPCLIFKRFFIHTFAIKTVRPLFLSSSLQLDTHSFTNLFETLRDYLFHCSTSLVFFFTSWKDHNFFLALLFPFHKILATWHMWPRLFRTQRNRKRSSLFCEVETPLKYCRSIVHNIGLKISSFKFTSIIVKYHALKLCVGFVPT